MLHVYRHVAGLRHYRPIVLTQKREGNFSANPLYVVGRSNWRFVSRWREKRTGEPWQISAPEVGRLEHFLKKDGCELLHVFFGNSAVHLLPLFRRLKIPLVVSFHGSDVAGSMVSPGYRAAVRELFSLAAAVPCRSEQLARRVGELGCPPEKLRLMRTILPELPFVPRHPPEDGVWRIVQAARLVRKKGIDDALRAFVAFRAKYPLATFTVAGEGPLLDELKGLAKELGVAEAVEFTGFLTQKSLRQIFTRAHIFLHPSRTSNGDVEGVPNAMLEAMATGLPVVTTRHGGIPEVIRDGDSGFLCPENDPASLTRALLQCASSPASYGQMSIRAAKTVREQFSPEKNIAAVEDIYRQAILAQGGEKTF